MRIASSPAPDRRRSRLVGIVIALVTTLAAGLLPGALSAARAADDGRWIGTWAASPQPLWPAGFPLPTNMPERIRDQTIRQIVRVGLGGRRVRVVLSNEYGDTPLVIDAARVALTDAGASTVAGSDRALTFAGRTAVTVPAGAPMVSDPVDLVVPPLARLSVSLHLPRDTRPSTFHWEGLQTAYLADGDVTAAPRIAPTATLQARVFLRGIEVDAPAEGRSVVAFGDSITDGAASTPGGNARWPDALARRLAPDRVAVLNAGISGARVLGSLMGDNALARFDRDVLAQPRVSTVIVMMGINDIAWPGTPFAPAAPPLSADDLTAGYAQLIARARAHGVRIVGATLTPFEGALPDSPITGYYDAGKEAMRQRINAWIRAPGHFDAVVDFDAVLRDPDHPTRMRADADSGDHLHPGDAGYRAMAEAVDLALLRPSR